jgi:hypothetical protein
MIISPTFISFRQTLNYDRRFGFPHTLRGWLSLGTQQFSVVDPKGCLLYKRFFPPYFDREFLFRTH